MFTLLRHQYRADAHIFTHYKFGFRA